MGCRSTTAGSTDAFRKIEVFPTATFVMLNRTVFRFTNGIKDSFRRRSMGSSVRFTQTSLADSLPRLAKAMTDDTTSAGVARVVEIVADAEPMSGAEMVTPTEVTRIG